MIRFVSILTFLGMTTNAVFAQGINSTNPAIPFGSNTSYSYGMMPTNLPTEGEYASASVAADAYTTWLNNFVEDCDENTKRVKFDNAILTVSEGIAYGMLLSAYAGDSITFNGLWAYYRKWDNSNGIMHWKISGCDAIVERNGATDAELDGAMALIVAAKQWPDAAYLDDALTLIQTIKRCEMEADGDTKCGDGWGPNSTRNPSYYAPAYYREFAKVDIENANFWRILAVNAAEEHLLTNRHSRTGLVSNWSYKGGAPNTSRTKGALYGYESIRNPWRMATDYVWNGPERAQAATDICAKISSYMLGKEYNLKVDLNTDGTGGAGMNGVSYMTALAALGGRNQFSLNSLYEATVRQNGEFGTANNSNYFNATLRCITLFMMTGNFWKPSPEDSPGDYTAIDVTQIPQTAVIYPSPVQSVVHIESKQTMQTIRIFDLSGVNTLQSTTNSQYETIDVSSLAQGIYFIHVEFIDGRFEKYRFVKQ